MELFFSATGPSPPRSCQEELQFPDLPPNSGRKRAWAIPQRGTPAQGGTRKCQSHRVHTPSLPPEEGEVRPQGGGLGHHAGAARQKGLHEVTPAGLSSPKHCPGGVRHIWLEPGSPAVRLWCLKGAGWPWNSCHLPAAHRIGIPGGKALRHLAHFLPRPWAPLTSL